MFSFDSLSFLSRLLVKRCQVEFDHLITNFYVDVFVPQLSLTMHLIMNYHDIYLYIRLDKSPNFVTFLLKKNLPVSGADFTFFISR